MKSRNDTEESADLNRRLGLVVKRRRQFRRLSQSELASRVRISQGTVCLIEQGKNLNLNTLRRIALELGYGGLGELLTFVERSLSKDEIRTIIRRGSLAE